MNTRQTPEYTKMTQCYLETVAFVAENISEIEATSQILNALGYGREDFTTAVVDIVDGMGTNTTLEAYNAMLDDKFTGISKRSAHNILNNTIRECV